MARVRPSKAAAAANSDAAADDEADEDAPKLLEAPVIMLEKLQALEKMISSLIKTELNLKEDQFTNKLIQTWSDPSSKEDELLDEAAMRARAKQGAAVPGCCAVRQEHAAHRALARPLAPPRGAAAAEKKLEKQERKGLKREQSAATQRNELIEKLTRAPVVLHANGEFGEFLGSGPADIVLQRITMELGGIVMLDVRGRARCRRARVGSVGATDSALFRRVRACVARRGAPLQDANVTFAYGRRYGLVGRNGIGKTTFLKHLAAKARAVPGEAPRPRHLEERLTWPHRGYVHCRPPGVPRHPEAPADCAH